MTAATETAIGCTTGPAWCVSHRGDVCFSEVRDHAGTKVFLAAGRHGRNIHVGAVWFDPSKAEGFASLFARFGQPELAATVRRLGELADAENLTGATS